MLLAAEKAVVRGAPLQVTKLALRAAVESAGYSLPEPGPPARAVHGAAMARRVLTLFGRVFGAVLFIGVVGEWFGLLEAVTAPRLQQPRKSDRAHPTMVSAFLLGQDALQ